MRAQERKSLDFRRQSKLRDPQRQRSNSASYRKHELKKAPMQNQKGDTAR